MNGSNLRSYAYDAFGNRTVKKDYSLENEVITNYTYNKNNQFIFESENAINKNYTYDRRGNLTSVFSNDKLIQKFTYNAAGYMVSASDLVNGKTSTYEYNGLGKRIGQSVEVVERPEKKIQYVLDLTRDYHNLLASYDMAAGAESTFFWDGNVVAARSNDEEDFYLQDDLGSPMALVGKNGIKEKHAYDEFGNN